MEKIRINKKIFISRPMNGVTRDEDNKLLKDIREALINEHILGNFVNAEVVNSWDAPVLPDGISDEQARVWMIGHSIQEMATADVLIFVSCRFASKGCAVEFEAYNRYKDIMQEQWSEALVYDANEKTLTPLSEHSGRYPWGPGLNRCVNDVANLIADLTKSGYPSDFIEDAINLSKKILDVGRANM